MLSCYQSAWPLQPKYHDQLGLLHFKHATDDVNPDAGLPMIQGMCSFSKQNHVHCKVHRNALCCKCIANVNRKCFDLLKCGLLKFQYLFIIY